MTNLLIVGLSGLNQYEAERNVSRSKAVLLMWIIFVISVSFCYAAMHVCLLMPCGHLLEKG